MLSCRFSRVYAAGVMGAIAVAFAIACQQTSDPPPSPPDDLAMGDMAVGPDLSPYNTPVITSISPTSGLNNVATSITITGTDFRPGAQVTVGGAACTGVSVASSTTISCTVPAKAVTCGPRDIVVTHPDDGKSATGVKAVHVPFDRGPSVSARSRTMQLPPVHAASLPSIPTPTETWIW